MGFAMGFDQVFSIFICVQFDFCLCVTAYNQYRTHKLARRREPRAAWTEQSHQHKRPRCVPGRSLYIKTSVSMDSECNFSWLWFSLSMALGIGGFSTGAQYIGPLLIYPWIQTFSKVLLWWDAIFRMVPESRRKIFRNGTILSIIALRPFRFHWTLLLYSTSL